MRILVIEDNDIKYSHVQSCLDEARMLLEIERAGSYQSGLRLLINGGPYGCVVLDMTLPVYDFEHGIVSANTLTFGGELILRESARRSLDARFIVLSQYDVFLREAKEVTFQQLRVELTSKYAQVLGCVRLDTSSISWKRELLDIVEHL